jgi:hypothetical protein
MRPYFHLTPLMKKSDHTQSEMPFGSMKWSPEMVASICSPAPAATII